MFNLDDDQRQKAVDFMQNHECTIDIDEHGFKKVGTIGGSITYCFTPTSLGTVEVIKCSCGAEVNLTNFDRW